MSYYHNYHAGEPLTVFPPEPAFTVLSCPCGAWTLEHVHPAPTWVVDAVEHALSEHRAECPALDALATAEGT